MSWSDMASLTRPLGLDATSDGDRHAVYIRTQAYLDANPTLPDVQNNSIVVITP